ncbi:ubiquitin-like protein ATG12, partial [Manacus vitellinus]|uniref:ubiquitin-like protein ATG12 n=1 Tax=Manacus vitellinus TaxID=328815 RepID=UPI00115DCA3A
PRDGKGGGVSSLPPPAEELRPHHGGSGGQQPQPTAPQSGGRSDGGEEAGRAERRRGPPSRGRPRPGRRAPRSRGRREEEIDVLLKAVGDTPIMKTKKWAVERTRTIQGLVDFIKKFLKLMASEQLFIYVNQSFAPSPDQEVGTLYECFGSDGKLVLHYCKTQAWG